MIQFTMLAPELIEDDLGLIPFFLSEHDPDPAVRQIDRNYRHGGGWSPMPKWTRDPETNAITYPEDDPLLPVAVAHLRDEQIYVYPYSWVAVVHPDGTFEVSRVD